MNCQQYEAALSEYVDGTLQASDEAGDAEIVDALEAHLAECERCRGIVEDLHTLRDAARRLDPRVPPAQVWSRIAAETGISDRRSLWSIPFPSPLRWRPLAAAAVLLIVLAGSWLGWRQMTTPVPASTVAARPAQGAPPDPALVQDVETELRLAEEHYVRAIAGLETIAASEGSELDAQTAEVLQANLTVIDAAIGESRAALQTEPSSEIARISLFEALRRKVTLLQDTIALINEMRKGNQEGAARIVSGLNP
jgi:anti-sigma factor RsiW